MYFDMKNYLKSTRNHITKYTQKLKKKFSFLTASMTVVVTYMANQQSRK
jgi:hypothetical protein